MERSWSRLGHEEIDRAAMEPRLGLDVPVYVQYGRWVGGIFLCGTLGQSLMGGDAVEQSIAQRLPVTIQLGLMAILIGLVIAVPVGIYSAIRQDTAGDYVGQSLAILGLATPNFWLATMVIRPSDAGRRPGRHRRQRAGGAGRGRRVRLRRWLARPDGAALGRCLDVDSRPADPADGDVGGRPGGAADHRGAGGAGRHRRLAGGPRRGDRRQGERLLSKRRGRSAARAGGRWCTTCCPTSHRC